MRMVDLYYGGNVVLPSRKKGNRREQNTPRRNRACPGSSRSRSALARLSLWARRVAPTQHDGMALSFCLALHLASWIIFPLLTFPAPHVRPLNNSSNLVVAGTMCYLCLVNFPYLVNGSPPHPVTHVSLASPSHRLPRCCSNLLLHRRIIHEKQEAEVKMAESDKLRVAENSFATSAAARQMSLVAISTIWPSAGPVFIGNPGMSAVQVSAHQLAHVTHSASAGPLDRRNSGTGTGTATATALYMASRAARASSPHLT
ncbi:hypothetical protein J6590_011266 [Homalodisca vitripennis]|nr:hypothetical protein J6590_011266 [Homalodisca vitripennis]